MSSTLITERTFKHPFLMKRRLARIRARNIVTIYCDKYKKIFMTAYKDISEKGASDWELDAWWKMHKKVDQCYD